MTRGSAGQCGGRSAGQGACLPVISTKHSAWRNLICNKAAVYFASPQKYFKKFSPPPAFSSGLGRPKSFLLAQIGPNTKISENL